MEAKLTVRLNLFLLVITVYHRSNNEDLHPLVWGYMRANVNIWGHVGTYYGRKCKSAKVHLNSIEVKLTVRLNLFLLVITVYHSSNNEDLWALVWGNMMANVNIWGHVGTYDGRKCKSAKVHLNSMEVKLTVRLNLFLLVTTVYHQPNNVINFISVVCDAKLYDSHLYPSEA